MNRSTVNVGDTFSSRGGAAYTVTSIDDRGGFTITRQSTGKAVKVSGAAVAKVLARAIAGEAFAYQQNTTKGGISYTVAIEAGVVYALRDVLIRDDSNRRFLPTT